MMLRGRDVSIRSVVEDAPLGLLLNRCVEINTWKKLLIIGGNSMHANDTGKKHPLLVNR